MTYDRLTPLYKLCHAIEAIQALEDMEEVVYAAQAPLQTKLKKMCQLYCVSEIQLFTYYQAQKDAKDNT